MSDIKNEMMAYDRIGLYYYYIGDLMNVNIKNDNLIRLGSTTINQPQA